MTVDVPGIPATEEPLPVASPLDPTRPEIHLTPRQWARKNLFPTPMASLLTVVFALALGYGLFRMTWFAFVSSDWEIVRANLRVFMIGRFPIEEAWRLWAALYVAAATAGLFSGAIVAHSYAQAESSGRPVERPGRWSWLRRYWPALACVAVILSQTRTWTPLLATLGAGLVLAGSRWLGLRLPGLARYLVVGLLVALILVYTLVAGSGGALWSLADAVQLALIAGAVLASTRALGRRPIRFAVLALIMGAVLSAQLATGEEGVGWNDWGGLHLTLFVTIGGIALSFPLGVLVALGRRSSLPVLRSLSVGYIELIRGVPLVALLFLGQYVIPLFFPNTVEPPSPLARALIAIVLFEAAYVAETVRGGLQSISRGQREAGQALGLSSWKITRLIVLPQALRAVIPAMVGQFISLFKDTSLLQIIGFLELLEVAENTASQPRFLGQGLHTVTFAFVALIYWAGSYTMSRESRRLEGRLGVGERR
jgi:general L-amino acid transport system permease protein